MRPNTPAPEVADAFTWFVKEAEPRLRHALCAAFGRERGREATAHALAYGWEHWDRIAEMENPIGYLWGVGRNQARRFPRPSVVLPEPPPEVLPWVEPGLPDALSRLSQQQRVVVMLTCGLDWSYAEVAELLGVSKSTVQTQVERALARLRRKLGVVE